MVPRPRVAWLLLAGLARTSRGLDNGLARTPPMGWMTWERYACTTDCSGEGAERCINEQLIKAMADRLADDGWRDAGYAQVSIDDCWALPTRDPQGRQQPDPARFPSGMKALGDYIHSKGLKFGHYSDIGAATCAGLMGMKGNFDLDAQTFADWGVDYLKVDGCNEESKDMAADYPALGAALNSTGRPIVYSCSWPAYMPHRCEGADGCMASLVKHCNLWRNYNDIRDGWESVSDIISFWNRPSSSDEMVAAAGPGHWNDADTLVVGNFGLSQYEEQAQFALWCMFASPLFLSNDLRDMPQTSKDILMNREVIAVNQDPLGRQGYCAAGCASGLRTWVRQLHNGDAAVVLQNTGNFGDGANISVKAADVPWLQPGATWSVRDLFAHQDLLPVSSGILTSYVHESSVRMLRLSAAKHDLDEALLV